MGREGKGRAGQGGKGRGGEGRVIRMTQGFVGDKVR